MDDLALALRAYERANTGLEAARKELRGAIVRALDGGMSQADVVRATGYTRETIRRIARDAGR